MVSRIDYGNIFKNEKCSIHPNIPFMFYCFDDKKFICNKCYKNHRDHNIEIVDDLKEVSDVSKDLLQNDPQKLLEKYISFKDGLMKLQKDLSIEVSKLSDQIEIMKSKFSSTSSDDYIGKSIFELPYEHYDRIACLVKTNGKFANFLDKMGQLSESLNCASYTNLHVINKEVTILEHSPFREGYGPEVLLDKKEGIYYLSEGNVNHYIVFDLGKEYYLKSIQMTIHNFECSVKTFKISVKTEGSSNFELVGQYECEPYWKTMKAQEFDVKAVGRIVRLDLVDNWGPGGGKFILVKRLYFNVGDLKK